MWYSRAVGRKRAPMGLPRALALTRVDGLDLTARAIHLLGRGNDESEGGTLAVVTMPDLAPLSAPRWASRWVEELKRFSHDLQEERDGKEEYRVVKGAGRVHRQGRSRMASRSFHWPAAPSAVLCSTEYRVSYEGGRFRAWTTPALSSFFFTSQSPKMTEMMRIQ